MQKFIGLTIALVASSHIMRINNYEWTIVLLVMAVGLGGIIYGDAE